METNDFSTGFYFLADLICFLCYLVPHMIYLFGKLKKILEFLFSHITTLVHKNAKLEEQRHHMNAAYVMNQKKATALALHSMGLGFCSAPP